MIGYAEHNQIVEDTGVGEKEPEWRAYFYPVLILAATMAQTFILSQYFERMFTVGMNLRTSLISALYRYFKIIIKVMFSNTSSFKEIVKNDWCCT